MNKKSIEELMIESYNFGDMCKGCLIRVMSPFSYICPIHGDSND